MTPSMTLVCANTGCVVDEPDELLPRRVVGTETVEWYCDRHDPLGDAAVAEHFEEVGFDA